MSTAQEAELYLTPEVLKYLPPFWRNRQTARYILVSSYEAEVREKMWSVKDGSYISKREL